MGGTRCGVRVGVAGCHSSELTLCPMDTTAPRCQGKYTWTVQLPPRGPAGCPAWSLPLQPALVSLVLLSWGLGSLSRLCIALGGGPAVPPETTDSRWPAWPL